MPWLVTSRRGKQGGVQLDTIVHLRAAYSHGRCVAIDQLWTGQIMPPRRASCCEIYNEMLYDLLNFTRTPLTERWDPDHGFTIPDLQRRECPTLDDMRKVTGRMGLREGQP